MKHFKIGVGVIAALLGIGTSAFKVHQNASSGALYYWFTALHSRVLDAGPSSCLAEELRLDIIYVTHTFTTSDESGVAFEKGYPTNPASGMDITIFEH